MANIFADAGRLILVSAGAAAGGRFGPLGAIAGGFLGSAAANFLFGTAGEDQTIFGPRLHELTLTTSTYGTGIQKCWGTMRVNGNIIWAPDPAIEEQFLIGKSGDEGLFGTGAITKTILFRYYSTFAVSLGEGTGTEKVLRIWMNGDLVWDRSGGVNTQIIQKHEFNFQFYDGSETQLPDIDHQNSTGVGTTPAYRGQCYGVFHRLPLAPFGNAVPRNIAFELSCANTPTYPKTNFNTAGAVETLQYHFDPLRNQLYKFTDNHITKIDLTTNSIVQDTAPIQQTTGHWQGDFTFAHAAHIDSLGNIYWLGDQNPAAGGAGEAYVHMIEPFKFQTVDTARSQWTSDPDDDCPEQDGWEFQEPVWDCTSGGPHGFIFVWDHVLPDGQTLPLAFAAQNNICDFRRVFPRLPMVMHCTQNKAIESQDNWVSACIDRERDVWFLRTNGTSTLSLRKGVVGGVVLADPDKLSQTPSEVAHQFFFLITTVENLNASPFLMDPDSGTNQNSRMGMLYLRDDHRLAIFAKKDGESTSSRAILYDIATESLISEYDDLTSNETFQGIGSLASSYGNLTAGYTSRFIRTVEDSRWIQKFDLETWSVVQTDDIQNWLGANDSFARNMYHPPSDTIFVDFNSGGNDVTRIFVDHNLRGGNTLDVVVADILQRGGLAATDYDVTGLSGDTVNGFVVSQISKLSDAIELLQVAYNFDLVESDFQVKAIKRGGSFGITIPQDDLGVAENDHEEHRVDETRFPEAERPMQVYVRYSDMDRDYLDGVQQAKRYVNSIAQTSHSITQASIDMTPLALTDTEAKEIADRRIFADWSERTQVSSNVGPKHLAVDPTDLITITDSVGHNVRVVASDIGAGNVIRLDTLTEKPITYTLGLAPGDLGNDSQTIGAITSSEPLPLDIPLLKDADYAGTTSTGIYTALGPTSSPYPGGVLWRSDDAGGNWNSIYGTTNEVTYGVVGNALGAAPSWGEGWDRTNTISVALGNGSLTSSTEELVITTGVNRALVGNEIIWFVNATFEADGTYTLDTFVRGGRGTAPNGGNHSTGELFVLLEDANIGRYAGPADQFGDSITYRAVTSGQDFALGVSKSQTHRAIDLKPYAPTDLKAIADSSDNVIVSWIRQSRWGHENDWDDGDWDFGLTEPYSDEPETYECELYVKDTTTVSVTKTTTAAEQPAPWNGDYKAQQNVAPWRPAHTWEIGGNPIDVSKVGSDVDMANTSGQMTASSGFDVFNPGDWVWVGFKNASLDQRFDGVTVADSDNNNRAFKVRSASSTVLQLEDADGNDPLTVTANEDSIRVYIPDAVGWDTTFQIGAYVHTTGWPDDASDTNESNDTIHRILAASNVHLMLSGDIVNRITSPTNVTVKQLATHAKFTAAEISAAGYSVGDDITVSVYQISPVTGRGYEANQTLVVEPAVVAGAKA